MYSQYESRLEKGKDVMRDLVYQIISAPSSNYNLDDYERLKQSLLQLQKQYIEFSKEQLLPGSDENTVRIFNELQAFYKKSIGDIDIHFNTLESSKIHFKA